MTIPLTFFYEWENLDVKLYGNIMREFKDNGAEYLVINDSMLKKIISDPMYLLNLRKLQYDIGIKFFEVHGLWSRGWDPCCTDFPRRPGIIADHKLAMNYAAELGCKTYVMHIGAFESVFFRTPNEELRANAVQVFEQLIPEAEKLGLVIAVENSYEISNTPDEVLYYINYFNHPNLACCFDAGHANIMTPGPGKTNDQYSFEVKEAWADNVVQYENAIEKLSPHIVTMHLHDNSGFGDEHSLPFTGTLDWQALTEKIAKLPRLMSLQSEVKTGATSSWSIRKLCETFRKLFPESFR